MIAQQFYLDTFQRLYKRGLEAHRAGDAKRARTDLLRAAEMLLKLAAASAGDLREARKKKAQEILSLAKGIAAKAPAKGAGGRAAAAAETEEDQEKADRWIVTDVPAVRMDDVAGLDDVKAVIRKRVVYPFQHPEVTRKFRKRGGGGVLLYGPPGTGKTMIAKAIAGEIDAVFFSVRCSDIISKWVGEAERNLKALFDAARARPRAVVFLDETEAIVSRRGGDSTVMNRVIPEFLSQVDGLQRQHGGLLLLGATNRPWDVDEAALRPGRFDELIYVPLPDVAARLQILARALEGVPMAEEVNIGALAADTDGLSGADLVALAEAAKDGPYEREIQTRTPQRLEAADVAAALERVRPSVSKAQLARYERFRAGR
jgi:SpoVK/Ycf46/Vps4 family AAA+-type ATPase